MKQVESAKNLTDATSAHMDAKAKSCVAELMEDDNIFGQSFIASGSSQPSGHPRQPGPVPSPPRRGGCAKNKCPVACAINQKRLTMKRFMACRDQLQQGITKADEVLKEVASLNQEFR